MNKGKFEEADDGKYAKSVCACVKRKCRIFIHTHTIATVIKFRLICVCIQFTVYRLVVVVAVPPCSSAHKNIYRLYTKPKHTSLIINLLMMKRDLKLIVLM